MKRTVKILLLLAFSSAILSGCNTARGVGEDIQDLGHIISPCGQLIPSNFPKNSSFSVKRQDLVYS